MAYNIQAKFVVKMQNLKRNEIHYNIKIVELRKTFDAEHSNNIVQDILMPENRIREDQEQIKQCAIMVEHIEIFL